jgi:hypothetical protein
MDRYSAEGVSARTPLGKVFYALNLIDLSMVPISFASIEFEGILEDKSLTQRKLWQLSATAARQTQVSNSPSQIKLLQTQQKATTHGP